MRKKIVVCLAVVTGLLPSTLIVSQASAKGCETFLEEMKVTELEIESPHHGRDVASIDKDPVAAKEAKDSRVKAMKEFLSIEDFDKQRALATVMVNFLLDRALGRPGDLTLGAALVNKESISVKAVRANDPRSPLHRYLKKAKADDVEDIKALTVYILKVKNLDVDATKAKQFLEAQIQKGNTHFRVLDSNCVIGDPVFQKMAMN